MTDFVKTGCHTNSLLNCLMKAVHQDIPVVDTNLDLLLTKDAVQPLLDIPAAGIGFNTTANAIVLQSCCNSIQGNVGEGHPVAIRMPEKSCVPGEQVRLSA